MAKKKRKHKRQKSKYKKRSSFHRVLWYLLLFVGVVFCFKYGAYLVQQREIQKQLEADAEALQKQREQLVYDTLAEAGYSPAGICGIMGNIAIEDPTFDPTAEADNGAYGIFQWTDTGNRKQKMKDWCATQGYDFASIEGQLAYAIYELEGGDVIACRLDDYLRSTTDAYTAACEFTAGFERCVTDSTAGGVYTGSIYPEYYGVGYQAMNKRINAAVNYYEVYSNWGKDFGTD